MMTRTTPRTTTFATMIHHTTTMIMRRIIDAQWYKFSYQHNLRMEIILNFVKEQPIYMLPL